MLREAEPEGTSFPPVLGGFHSQVAPTRGSEGQGVLGAGWGRDSGVRRSGLWGTNSEFWSSGYGILSIPSLMTLWPDNNLGILTF